MSVNTQYCFLPLLNIIMFRLWVSNLWPAVCTQSISFYYVLHDHMCKSCRNYKNYTVSYAGRFTTYHYCTYVAHEKANNNSCGPSPKKGWLI